MIPHYREFAPPIALAHIVEAFWCLSVSGATTQTDLLHYRVLPDGCIDLFCRFQRLGFERGLDNPVLMVYGPTDRFDLVNINQSTEFVGVRFKPGEAFPVLKLSPLSLQHQTVEAQVSVHLVPLFDKLCECRYNVQVLNLLQKTVLEQMVDFGDEHSPRVREALRLLWASGGQMQISVVADKVGVSERTLRRDITTFVGLSPKVLARILRFQKTLALLRTQAQPNLCAIALENGYADQAHMSREFQELAGLTPTAFL